MRRLVIGFLLLFQTTAYCGTKVIDYGFEDFVAYSGTASPAPNYIFGTWTADKWTQQITGTHIVSTCGGLSAHSGSYFFHTQYHTDSVDTCTGAQPTSINHELNMGAGPDVYYPTGAHNTYDIATSMSGETELVFRFYMRTTGNWTSTQTGVDGVSMDLGTGLKFIRQAIGTTYFGDDTTIDIKALNDDDSTDPQIGIYRPRSTVVFFHPGVNWQDGDWHPFCYRVNNVGGGEYRVRLYLDDWDLSSDPFADYTITIPTPGDGDFDAISMNGNWSGTPCHPVDPMGIDFDSMELWIGLPDESPATPPVSMMGGTGGTYVGGSGGLVMQ